MGKLPTPDEVTILVKDKIITNEEAREILFTEVDEKESSIEDAKHEIKFLRELVENLAKDNNSRIIETIRYIEKPYYQWDWYKPYGVWCGSISNNALGVVAGTTYLNGTAGANTTDVSFSAIS